MAPEDAGAHPRGHAGRAEVLAVLVLSLGCAVAVFHAAWAHPLTTQVGPGGDADEYSWFLAWVPFALGHGLDPLLSSYAAFPHGVNLMWNTSVLLPSFLMSPFTVVFGAAFSYNVLMTAAPALGTTLAFVAFRRWAGPLPSLAGSFVFGFSPYMFSQSNGHLAQTLIMSAPVLLVLLDRILVLQRGRAWSDGLLLGLLAWAQLLTGEEILALEALTAAIGVVVLCVLQHRSLRAHFAYAAKSLATAGGLAAVLSAPFLAVQYLGPAQVRDVHPPNIFVSDLFNFFVPTDVTKLAPAAALRVSQNFTGNASEQGAYIGVPLILLVVFAVVAARHRGVVWPVAAAGLGAAVLSLGPTLHWDGHVTHHNLPFYYLEKLPLFHNVLADRFASMTSLAVGLLVAIGCDELRRLAAPAKAAGWSLAALGLVALIPITDFPAAASPSYSAFEGGLACPAPSAHAGGHRLVALLVPAVDEMDLRWQAEASFCFAMPSDTGMTGTNSADVGPQGILRTLGDPGQALLPMTPAAREEAAAEIARLGIDEVVVVAEWPAVPQWSPQGQANAVAWLQWLLGEPPRQSDDPYRSYVWSDLPPVSDIASGDLPSSR